MKEAKTPQELVNLLKSRGLLVEDDLQACKFFENVSYYRLSGYTQYFQIDRGDSDSYRKGASLSEIQSVYAFDDALRRVVWSAICKFEVSLKARLGNAIGMKYGPSGYVDAEIYSNQDHYDDLMKKIDDEMSRSKEVFVQDHRERRTGEEFPVWMALEILSMGTVSKLVNNLKDPKFVKALAEEWQMTSKDFLNSLYSIGLLRNACAHHGRIWGRQSANRGAHVTYPRELAESLDGINPRSTYWTIKVLNHLLKTCYPGNTFERDVLALFFRNQNALNILGVPAGTLPAMF